MQYCSCESNKLQCLTNENTVLIEALAQRDGMLIRAPMWSQ